MEKLSIDRRLTKIEVTKLFGYYSYTVDHSKDDNGDDSLLVIYGDNGSGKTTLLKMIFYLLSPRNGGGHKTKLSQIKFSSFRLTLNDGTIVSACRRGNEVIGSYTIAISQNGYSLEVYLKVNSEGAIREFEYPEIARRYAEFLQKISSLNIAINFLSEDRKLLSFSPDQHSKSIAWRRSKSLVHGKELISEYIDEAEDNVQLAIKNLENWLKSNALKGAKAGEENANTIYTKLLKQISTPKINKVSTKQVKNLLEKIKKIGLESLSFYQSGLVSQIEIDDFEHVLKSANDSNISLIYNILEPYIEGVQGRLNSLYNVQNILTQFLQSINDYFSHKTISYNLSEGFVLKHNELNEPIEFQTLSSGEKQLLHLFCSVITSSEKSTVFIIDEPEISLNIKWQRKLIKTLLSFSVKKNVQFIFASHSIELLSGHSNSVYKLTNLD